MIIKRYKEIESTHKYIKQNYKNYAEKIVVIAEKQKNAIGTKGRTWFTGNENNIAMSILYKPNCKPNELDGLTIKIAQIIQKEIKQLYNIELKIKEPNDLMLNNKKISGILTETSTIGDRINYLKISIGFNVNEINFPTELENIATSLKKEIRRDFDKEELIEKFIISLENIF